MIRQLIFAGLLCSLGVAVGCDDDAVRACNTDENCAASEVCSEGVCVAPIPLDVRVQDVPDQRPPPDVARDFPDFPDVPDFLDDMRPDPGVDFGFDFDVGFEQDLRPPGSRGYAYVRVDDISDSSGSIDGGADIDAILIEKADGRVVAAETVEAYIHGGGSGELLDPVSALGFPDAFYNWPDVEFCAVDFGFVSLGGLGGTLVVGMADFIEPGDALLVYEVGDCQFEGGFAIPDPAEVFVSVSPDLRSDWIYVGGGTGPEIILEIPALP